MFYANSINQGITYSKPSKIGAEGSNVARPYLLASGVQVWMAWKEFDGTQSSIHLKQSDDDGLTWSKAKLISKTTGYSDHPLLLKRERDIYLSWLTRTDGYQLLQVGNIQ